MYRIALIHDKPIPATVSDALAAAGSIHSVTSTEGADGSAYAGAKYEDIDSLLGDAESDLLWVHTRTGYHAEYVIRALQAGKDVVCNTPLCLTASAAWQIVETAKYTGRKFFVLNGPCAFWEQVRQEAGEIRRFHAWARITGVSDGSLFPDGGSLHRELYGFMEALAGLLGPIESVDVKLEGNEDEAEKSGQVEIRLLAGGSGHIDWSTEPEPGTENGFSIRVEGTRSMIEVAGTIESGILKLAQVQSSGMPDPGQGPGLPVFIQAAMRGEEVPALDPFRALRTVELIDRIYRKTETGAE